MSLQVFSRVEKPEASGLRITGQEIETDISTKPQMDTTIFISIPQSRRPSGRRALQFLPSIQNLS
jgi:hypothetical protein